MVKIGVRLRKLLSQIKTEYHFLDHPLDCVLMFFLLFLVRLCLLVLFLQSHACISLCEREQTLAGLLRLLGLVHTGDKTDFDSVDFAEFDRIERAFDFVASLYGVASS